MLPEDRDHSRPACEVRPLVAIGADRRRKGKRQRPVHASRRSGAGFDARADGQLGSRIGESGGLGTLRARARGVHRCHHDPGGTDPDGERCAGRTLSGRCSRVSRVGSSPTAHVPGRRRVSPGRFRQDRLHRSRMGSAVPGVRVQSARCSAQGEARPAGPVGRPSSRDSAHQGLQAGCALARRCRATSPIGEKNCDEENQILVWCPASSAELFLARQHPPALQRGGTDADGGGRLGHDWGRCCRSRP